MQKTRKTVSQKKSPASPKKKAAGPKGSTARPPRPSKGTQRKMKTPKSGRRMTTRELKHYEKILLQEREKEMRQLGLIQEDLDRTQVDSAHDLSAFPTHMPDLGTDTAAREKTSILATAEGNVIYEIDQALRRIYDKTFGICEVCTKNISKKRLEAVPYARLCITCQEIEEKENAE